MNTARTLMLAVLLLAAAGCMTTVSADTADAMCEVHEDGDEWYIGIDEREFYIVPDAAIWGG